MDAGPGVDPPLWGSLETCVRGDEPGWWRMIDCYLPNGYHKTSNEMITSVTAACKRKPSTLADVSGPTAQRDLVKWQWTESTKVTTNHEFSTFWIGQQFQKPVLCIGPIPEETGTRGRDLNSRGESRRDHRATSHPCLICPSSLLLGHIDGETKG